MAKIKQKHDNLRSVLNTQTDSYDNFRVTSVEITVKGDRDKDLRITYSTSCSSEGNQEWVHGICTIEEVKKRKLLGLFERKKTLFQSKGQIDYGIYHFGELENSRSAIRTLDRERLDALMRSGKILFPNGLQKMDDNLAKIEKLTREVAASQIEFATDEHEKKLQLKRIKEDQKNAVKAASETAKVTGQKKYNAEKAAVIHSLATRFLQDDYKTAIERLTAKVAPKKAPVDETKPTNAVKRTNSNVPTISDQRE